MTNRMIFIFGAIVFLLAFLIIWTVSYFWKMSNRSDVDSLTTGKLRQNGGAEKRQHPRFDVNWPVSIETIYGTITAEVKNISLGGAFICCKKPLQLRKIFRMTMIGPENEPLLVTAQVAWSNANMPEEKVVNRGMGVRFINMSERHLQLVKQICQESD
jgi:Tfp pilus assembly protein PilZ